jgi:hypothetical protein
MNRAGTAVIVALILAQVALAGYAFATGEEDTRPIPPITPQDEPLFPLAFEAILPFVDEQAKAWREDAVLVQSNLQVDWHREDVGDPVGQVPRGGWIMFAYVSGDDLLTLRLDRGSGTIVETRVVLLDEDSIHRYLRNPVDYGQARVASLTAMTAVEAAYGNQYRSKCYDRRHVSWATILTDEDTGERFWHIEYEEREADLGTNMTADVSWQTGEIVNVTHEDLPCSEIVVDA